MLETQRSNRNRLTRFKQIPLQRNRIISCYFIKINFVLNKAGLADYTANKLCFKLCGWMSEIFIISIKKIRRHNTFYFYISTGNTQIYIYLWNLNIINIPIRNEKKNLTFFVNIVKKIYWRKQMIKISIIRG